MATTAALDVGGTSIKGALVADDATLSGRITRPTNAERGPDAVLESILDAGAELVAHGAAALGIVVPGVVEDGIARYATNLGWHDVPLQRLAAERLGRPVAVGHDVGAAGLAEAAATGHGNLLLVVLGTGIANVTVLDGHPLRGATGRAGEIGHIPVYPDGEPCRCGQRGCLEVYASAAGIARRYLAADGTAVGADAAVIAAALDTDEVAAHVWREAVSALALALASATLLVDPERIVLAGGLASAGERLTAPTRDALAALLAWRAAPPIEISVLGADAGLRGAALIARRLASDLAATT